MADSDDFLDQTKEVASIFLDLYLSPKAILPGQRSPYPGSGNRIREKEGIVVSDSDYVGTSQEAGELPSSLPRKDNAVVAPSPAILIAQRLRQIGDAIDKRVPDELQTLIMEQLGSKSVYQVTLPAFKMMCRTLLTRCSVYFSSGWEQVTAVYMSMSHLVKEIRTEEEKATGEPGGAAAAVRSPREIQMESFVGLALMDLNLEQWIGEQGGMNHIAVPQQGQVRNVVPIEGTSVDK